MKSIGLTGGIGSGKSTVARLLQERLIPVYYADDRAKILSRAQAVQEQLSALFSLSRDAQGFVNNADLAKVVFQSESALTQLNALIHPLVEADFMAWRSHQTSPIAFMEAALIYESKMEKLFDAIVCVYAPPPVCLKRVQQRDGISEQMVLDRMKMQIDPQQKKNQADYVIMNDGITDLNTQVDSILKIIGI